MMNERLRAFFRTLSCLLLGLIAGAMLATPQTPTPTPTPVPVETPAVTLPNEPPPVAPDFEAPVRPMPGPERVGVDLANQLTLTLDQAIELALKNNNNIDVSRNNLEINRFNLRAARGVFDPLLSSENYFESATTPTASAIGGAVNGAVTQRRLFSSGGVSGLVPWGGGEYSAIFNASRTTTSNTNSFLNPQYPSSFTATYTQPLFRNFGIDNNRRQIYIAQKNILLTDSQFKQQAIDTVTQVEQAYWNLVYALRNLQVQIDAVKQARAQLESNERQVRSGILAPIDVVAATAQVTTLEQQVFAAQEAVTVAENTLKTLLLPDRTAAEWSRPLTPVSPITLEPPRISLEVAISEALKNRPELEQLSISEEINQIDQRYFRNQTKPQIDVVGTYTSQGLAGTPTAIGIQRGVPQIFNGGLGTSLGLLLGQNFPTYRAGINISLPWGNHVAKANLGRSLVEAERLANQRAQTEQTIEAEVRNSLQALRSAEARLASAAAARDAAEKLYESEQRQFRAGTTTLFLVLQRQTELITARGRELQAQTDLNRAIAEFQRATGTTLSVKNIEVSSGASIQKK